MIIRKNKNGIIFKRESLSTYRTMSGLLRGFLLKLFLLIYHLKTVLLIYDSNSVLSLESKLVTYSNLENIVVTIAMVVEFCNTDVVTCIEYKVLILIRETNWDRKVECLHAITCTIFVNHETWLNTCFESKTLYWVVIQSDRDVEIAWSPLRPPTSKSSPAIEPSIFLAFKPCIE